MANITPATSKSPTIHTTAFVGNFLYKTIAIYPTLAGVRDALTLLNNAGFTTDQISLLGHERDHWHEEANAEWETYKTVKGTMEGAALGSFPALVLAAGVIATGGASLLVAGPMTAALTALGMGALGGAMMGGASGYLDTVEEPADVVEEVEEALGRGHWVVIAHSHDEDEAKRAQAMLRNTRTVKETEFKEYF